MMQGLYGYGYTCRVRVHTPHTHAARCTHANCASYYEADHELYPEFDFSLNFHYHRAITSLLHIRQSYQAIISGDYFKKHGKRGIDRWNASGS